MKKLMIGIVISSILIAMSVLLYTQMQNLDFMNEQLLITDDNKKQLHFIHWIDFPDEIFQAFEEEYPEIEIRYDMLDKTNYSNHIRALLVSGRDIDLFGIKPNDYTDFMTRGYLEVLSNKDYIENLDKTVNDNIKDLIFSNSQYAIAYNSCSYGIWYNKSIFERNDIEIPKSYEEFIEVCHQLKNAGINPMVIGGKDEAGVRILYLMSDTFAKESIRLQENLYNDNMKWTDKTITDAFYKVTYLINKEFIMKDSIYLTYQQAFQEFVKGSAAMTIMSSNSMNLAQKDFEQQAGEFGVFLLPINHSGSPQTNLIEYGNELIGIFLHSSLKEEANLFLSFLTREDIVKRYIDYAKLPVTVKNIDITNIKYATQWKQLERNINLSATINFLDYRLEEDFDLLTKELMIGKISVEDMANELNLLQEQIKTEDKKSFQ